MQANVSHQSAIDYIFGLIDTIDGQTYESMTNRNITKTASVKSIEIKSEKKLPVPRQRLKEKSRLLPTKAIDIMTEWYDKNYYSPYPSFRECEQMAIDGGISINQVKQWFVNVRRRTQNKNRITRDNRTTDDYKINSFLSNNFYLDASANQTNETLNQNLNQPIKQQLDTTAMYESSGCYPCLSASYQSQYQIPLPTTFPNYYTPNNTTSSVFSNSTLNYTPFNANYKSTSPVYSPYNYYKTTSFNNSYTINSPNSSLDYSNTSSSRLDYADGHF